MHQKPHNSGGGGSASALMRNGWKQKFPFLRGAAALMTALGLSAAAASAASFTLPGWLNYEYYPGKDRVTIEAGTAGTPSTAGTVVGSDKSGYITSMEAGNNFAETYGNRMFGVFMPPSDGDYVFFIASDDDSDLFLSTDSDPAHKHLIAQELGWSGIRVWNAVGDATTGTVEAKRSDLSPNSTWPGATGAGATINLDHTKQYYIEAVHHEGTGGDNVGVFYKLAAGADPVDAVDGSNLTGPVIGVILPAAPAAPNVSITTQPANTTLYINGSGALSVVVSSDSPFPLQYQWRKGGTAIDGATGASLNFGTPALTDAGSYDVQITYVGAGGTPQTITSTAATVTVLPSPFYAGVLRYEFFPTITDKTIVEAGNGPPNTGGTVVGSDKNGFITSFESGNNFAANYVNKISGYFIPPKDGDYVFFIASDDDADLFLSTDADPANKKLIAAEPQWDGIRTWVGATVSADKRSDTFSASEWPTPNTITLVKGTKYYIEADHHEGGGGDNLGVTYKLASDADPANGSAPTLTGPVIGADVPPQTVTITTQPVSASVFAGTPVKFTVLGTTVGPAPVTYQWRKNGVVIPNAITTSYSFVADTGDNNTTYDVLVSAPGVTTPTTAATLTVKPGSISVAGKLKREYFPGFDRQTIENGTAGLPAIVSELTSFETISNIADNYGERVSGFFQPAVDGDYVFFVAADDDTDLFLSTDATIAHKQLIAQELGWSAVREYTTVPGTDQTAAAQKRSDQFSPDGGATKPFSAGIHLLHTQQYYIEAVHHEGTGGDNLAVTFKLAADPDPASSDIVAVPNTVGDPSLLTGPLISYKTGPVTSSVITTQPHDISSYEAQSVTLSVVVTTDSEVTPIYQWRKGGTAIVGATGPDYTIGFLALTDAGSYDVVITTPNLSGAGSTLTSTAATLSVFPAPLITGLLKYDYFPGKTRTDVEAGNGGTPSTAGTKVGGDKSGYITLAETDSGFADSYANRISGFFIPPVTGDFVFFVNGDDDCDLFLSTDDKPANKKLIAQETGWSNYRLWTQLAGGGGDASPKRSDLFANSQWPGASVDPATTPTVIHLTAATLYYIEGVHHEGGGGDNFGMTYKLAADPDPLDTTDTTVAPSAPIYDASRLSGNVIGVKLVPPTLTTPPTLTAAYATTNGVILIFSQPIDHSTLVAGNFSFTTVTTPAPAVTTGAVNAREVLQGNNVVTVATVPTTGFLSNTTYTVHVAGVKNTAAIAIAAGSTVDVTTPVLTLDFNEADASLPDPITAANNGTSSGLGPTPGSVVDGAGPDGSGAFFLTEAFNGEQGALIIPDLVNGDPVTNYTATFKLFIGHGSGNPADGMTFSFGNNIDVATALTLPFEEGAGVISVDFDTYNNGGNPGPNGQAEAPAFDVKLNGNMIGFVGLPQSAIVNDEWVDVIIALNSDNSITAIYNGVTYFDHLSLNNPVNLLTGAAVASYTPISNGIILFGGRTGGEHSEQAIDNFTMSVNSKGGVVVTGGASHITTSITGNTLTISWDKTGKLQSSPTVGVGATWTDVANGGTSPANVTIGSGNSFFRVVATP